jgi:hypothetical protein
MKKLHKLSLLIALLGLAGWAQAQKLTPGLWENTISMKSQNAEMDAAMSKMQAELAKMPADQRKMMEEMMSKRGVAMAPAAGGAPGTTMAVRSCISKEQAERGEPPEDDKRQCKRESLTRSGSSLKFKVVCSSPPSTGEGEFTFVSDKAYSGKMTMTSQVSGKSTTMDMQQSGKWLGSDCGTLKPVGKP